MIWRVIFWAAAAYNWLVGLPMLLAPALLLQMMGAAAPADLSFHRISGALIVCFGGLYAFIAEDPKRYRPLAWLGVAGKLGVVALSAQALMAGLTDLSSFSVALGDLAFVVAFVVFLFTYRCDGEAVSR